MIVKLTEVYETNKDTTGSKYSFREVFVNPEHIVCLREDEKYKRLLSEIEALKDSSKSLETISIGDTSSLSNQETKN